MNDRLTRQAAKRHMRETGHRVEISPGMALCLECRWRPPIRVRVEKPEARPGIKVEQIDE